MKSKNSDKSSGKIRIYLKIIFQDFNIHTQPFYLDAFFNLFFSSLEKSM